MTKQHPELSTMSAFCCAAKILFYLVLICYHMGDFFFDWYTFAVLLRDHKFSGVSISKSDESMIQIPFGLTCLTGTIFSFAMIVAYIYFIKHHWYCMNNASYSGVKYSDDDVWFPGPDHKYDKTCTRNFVNPVSAEFWISVLELFLKDDFQSGILFWAYYGSQSSATSNPGWMSIAFSVCSIVAHLKLCLCFITKFCGWGAGEERCGEDDVMKAFLCIIGFGGSAICLFLTAAAFVNEVN